MIIQRLLSYILVASLLIVSFIIPVSAKTYYNGPKGGCYYLSSSGKKVYVSHQYCSRDDEGDNALYNSSTKKTYYTGPRGGCFYYGKNWEKIYVVHSYCLK